MEPHGSKRGPVFNGGEELLAFYPADLKTLRLERDGFPNY